MNWSLVIYNLENQRDYYSERSSKSLTEYQKQRFENCADFASILASALREGLNK